MDRHGPGCTGNRFGAGPIQPIVGWDEYAIFWGKQQRLSGPYWLSKEKIVIPDFMFRNDTSFESSFAITWTDAQVRSYTLYFLVGKTKYPATKDGEGWTVTLPLHMAAQVADTKLVVESGGHRYTSPLTGVVQIAWLPTKTTPAKGTAKKKSGGANWYPDLERPLNVLGSGYFHQLLSISLVY